MQSRQRDSIRERQERWRYALLRRVNEIAGGDCKAAVSGLRAGQGTGMEREEIYRQVLFLAQNGYLEYRGAGPRVCLTRTGVEYLQSEAGRRRSVR